MCQINNEMNERFSEEKGSECDLYDYFRINYGPPTSLAFKKARDNFADSLAAYSLTSYILQIKDRHNANLILTKDGHMVHIDFGFFLTDAPGKGLKFEASTFKLKADYVAILGGVDGLGFKRFRKNMVDGFLELNKQSTKLILLVQMVAHS